MKDHPKVHYRLTKLVNLNEAAGDKYCWANMVTLAQTRFEGEDLDDRKEACRQGETCKETSKKTGHCYCGKFVMGKRPESPEELQALWRQYVEMGVVPVAIAKENLIFGDGGGS